VFIIFIRCL